METTMRNENSGVSPKLREFGPIRVLNLMEVTRDGATVVLDLSSDTLAPVSDPTGFVQATQPVSVQAGAEYLREFKFALGYTYGELYKLGKHETGFIRARLHLGEFVVDGCVA